MNFDCNKLQKGERHGLIKVRGKIIPERASYMGPGTKIIERLKAGCLGKSVTDSISKAHDIRYGLAENSTQTRYADERMVAALKKARDNGTDNWFNIAQGLYGIGTKIRLEEAGLMRKGSFNVPKENMKNYSNEDRALLRKALRPLEMKGYGKRKVAKKKKPKKKNKK